MAKKKRKADIDFNIGGQAVFEGVMYRGKKFWSLAVRKPEGDIVRSTYPLTAKYATSKWSKLPFIRGLVMLIDAMYLGFKALQISANQAFGEEVEISKKEFGFSTFFAILVVVGLFVLFPLWLAKMGVGVQTAANSYLFSTIEGLVRLLLFVLYLVGISFMPDIRRVFQYHGAEHMVIHAFEHGETLNAKNAKRYCPLHVSCGTSFIIFVLLIMIVLHAFIRGNFVVAFLIRLALVPVVAGISYEIIRIARKYEESLLVSVISFPGLAVQKLTTRKPDLKQLEVAVESLEELLVAEGVKKSPSGEEMKI